jgi:hypothetical protein
MSVQSYSVLIPHIFMNIPIQKIKESFEKLDLGKVEKIDSVIKMSRDGYYYRMAFIHFEYWNMKNIAARNLREKIENPNKEARLVYDDPWYWLLLPNKSTQQPIHTEFEKLKLAFQNQIQKIENEVECIYEELYKREYIPIEKQPEWLNDSSHTFAPIYPMENEYDDSVSLSSTNSVLTDGIESYDSMESMDYNTEIDDEVEQIYKNRYDGEDRLHLPPLNRAWMTMNVCDNA